MSLTRLAAFAIASTLIASVAQAEPLDHRYDMKQASYERMPSRTGYVYDGTVLPHPSGCPRRLFCGCGTAMKVFGNVRRDLWRASAWLRFPRTSPGPGMVVVWPGRHVAVIESIDGNGNAVLYDPNGGRGLTWRHTRSIRGLPVVNPHG